MSTRQYIGARYVPLIDGAYDATKDYEPLTVVLSDDGNSYTSKTYVPAGTPLTNSTYWALTGDYNAQVAAYRAEVLAIKDIVDNFKDTLINAVVEGVDNSGLVEVSDEINTLIENNPGKRIYFPAGKYLLANPIIIPNNGVFMVCDSDAEFFSDSPINNLVQLGDGLGTTNLDRFGIIGGKFKGTNVQQAIILTKEWNYSAVLQDVYIYDVVSIGLQLSTTNAHSSQVYINNLTIIGRIEVVSEATGIMIYGTDNFLNNIQVGRCQIGINLGGSGNILENVHVWNNPTKDMPDDPEDLAAYCSIRNHGNNRITNLHIDNGYKCIDLSNTNTELSVTNVVFNYDNDGDNKFDENGTACMVYYRGSNQTLKSSFNIENAAVTMKDSLTCYVRSLVYATFNPSQDYIELSPITSKFDFRLQPQLINKLPMHDEFNNIMRYGIDYPVVANYAANPDVSKYYLIGYIADVKGCGVITVTDGAAGHCDIYVQVGNSHNITVTQGKLTRFSANKKLFIANTPVTLDGRSYFPIYINYTATDYNMITFNIKGTLCGVYARRLFYAIASDTISDTSDGTVIDLYTYSMFKYFTKDFETETIADNNTLTVHIPYTLAAGIGISGVLSAICSNANLNVEVIDVGATIDVRLHNRTGSAQTVNQVQVQVSTTLS